VSSTPLHERDLKLTTLVVICTDCIGSYKSNYHTITTNDGSDESYSRIASCVVNVISKFLLATFCFCRNYKVINKNVKIYAFFYIKTKK